MFLQVWVTLKIFTFTPLVYNKDVKNNQYST